MSAPLEAELEKTHADAADEYARTFLERAGKVGDVARQLAFAGIAIVWLFKSDAVSGIAVPWLLGIALVLFGSCLFLDLLQAITLAIQSELWHQMWTRNTVSGRHLELARFYLTRRPFRLLLMVELVLLGVAYGFVVAFFFSTLHLI